MIQKFFGKLRKFVDNFGGQLSHATYARFLDRADSTVGSYLPNKERYIACAGSKSIYRGFPCSKWQMWHFLTLQAYRSNEEGAGKKVIQAMRDYVINFFTCQTCREHFEQNTQTIDTDYGYQNFNLIGI